MQFAKWQGLGNDYIIVSDEEATRAGLDASLAAKLCDRHFGIGGDGILVLGDSDSADARMRIFNPDGSMAEMCGNGIRMAALYLLDRGLVTTGSMSIETRGGIVHPTVTDDDLVAVDMGVVRTDDPVSVSVTTRDGERTYEGRKVWVGNPHFVMLEDPDTSDVHGHGPLLETHSEFPDRTNVEFIRIDDPQTVTMRVWERGVGETLACGSGACAVGVAAVLDGGCTSPVTVNLPGGPLLISVDEQLRVTMTGPAAEIYSGKLDVATLSSQPPRPTTPTRQEASV